MNTIWDELDDLSNDAILLYVWSWTNPRCGMAGLYRCPRRKLLDGRLSDEQLGEALRELANADLLHYTDGVVWNKARVGRLAMLSEQIAKSIAKDVAEIDPGNPLVLRFLEHYGTHPKLEPRLTLTRPSPEGQENPDTEPNGRPSPDPHPRVTGRGSGYGRSRGGGRDAEFEEWLEHYREVTGRQSVRGSKSAADAFAARRKEGRTVEELKRATVGCHSDEFCREKGFDVPDTILRASKVERYIQLAERRNGSSGRPTKDRSAYARVEAAR